MQTAAQGVAGFKIARDGSACGISARNLPDWRALHYDQRLSNIESQLGVERHGAAVKRGLHQPHPWKVLLGGSVHDRSHQLPAHTSVLRRRIDRDWTDARNRAAFIEAIAADNLPLLLSDYAEKARMGKQVGDNLPRHFRSWKVGWKVVMLVRI